MTQTQIEKQLREDFNTVTKYPITDESKILRELHDLVKDYDSDIVFSEVYLRINDKVLDLENGIYFIVSDEIKEED